MRIWTIWIAIQSAFWGLAAIATHQYAIANPQRIAIVLDDSHPMRTQWSQALDCTRALGAKRRYREFAVLSPKRLVHPWKETGDPPPNGRRPYGPRNIEDARRHALIEQADRVLVVSNAETLPDAVPRSWKLRRIGRAGECPP